MRALADKCVEVAGCNAEFVGDARKFAGSRSSRISCLCFNQSPNISITLSTRGYDLIDDVIARSSSGCGAFTTRMKPKLTTNCGSIVIPTMLMPGVATPCSTARTIGIMRRGRAAEAEMNQGEKQSQHRQNEQRGCVLEAEFDHREVGEPGRALGLQQRRSDADADAEPHDRAPRNPRLCFLPGHDFNARQEKHP